jgi:hypothetical protein
VADIDTLKQCIEIRTGCASPLEFLEHVESINESIVATHSAIANRDWRFYSGDDLLAKTQIDRHRGVELDSVALYGLALQDVGIAHLNGPESLPIGFLNTTCSFASDNCDFLFFTPDTSVWLFHHDGHEIQRISTSFAEFANGIVWPQFTKFEGSELNEYEKLLVGHWRPVSSETDDPAVFDDLKHDLVLKLDRTVKLIFGDEEADERWHANSEHFVFTLQGSEIIHSYQLTGDTLDVTTRKFGDHTRFERAG